MKVYMNNNKHNFVTEKCENPFHLNLFASLFTPISTHFDYMYLTEFSKKRTTNYKFLRR